MSEEIKRLALMVRVSDDARADIALTPDRSYYRIATDDSIEDGELHAVKDFENAARAVVEAYTPLPGDAALGAEMRVQLFVNNRLQTPPATEGSLQRLIAAVAPLMPEFEFLYGFK